MTASRKKLSSLIFIFQFDFQLEVLRLTGKMKQLFEKASELPRHQQQKVAAVLEAFIAQHSIEKKNAFK
jgi:hypothetical protein